MSKIRIKKLLFVFFLIVAIFTVAHFALAETLDVGLEHAADTGLGTTDPRIMAAKIIRIVLGFLGIIAVGIIMYAGWLYMTAEGDSEKVDRAKKILIGAVIGLIICLASFAIASFILNSLLDASGANTNNNGGGGGGTVTPGGGIPNLPGEGQPCLTNPLDTQCAAGQCAAGLTCSSSDCLCKKITAPGEGESCDGDINVDGCQAVDCASNLVCSSSDNCTCVKNPLIAWVSPIDASSTPNGAVGNFITIGGRYFGTTTGQVIFMGDPNNPSDDKVASFPNEVNPLCLSFWQDTQIIAVVPPGAVNGPIKVIDSRKYYDTTDDNRGARINDFVVNEIKRPGLCQVEPSIGGLDDQFNLQGNAFDLSPRFVYFGNSKSATEAKNIKNWISTAVDASVPNINDGENSIFVRTGTVDSNSLAFTIFNDTNKNPVIEYIEPPQGPAGQYITIYGRNFKIYNAQKSSVKFYSPNDPDNKINADIDFPEACRNNWWHDTYIVVKVPKVNDLGVYKVEVTNTESRISLPVDFTINNDTPTPGLCLLDPNNGPIGWPVSAYGERFGSTQGSGRVQYYNNKDATISNWSDERINSNVPLQSVSGPFKIIDKNSSISNSLPFRVGKCTSNSECDLSEECCGGGTYWSGICRPGGTCNQGAPLGCAFGWTFSTKSGECALNQEKCDIPDVQVGSPVNFNCCAKGQCNKLTGQCDSCPPNKPDQCDGDLKCCSTGGCKDLDNDGKTECSDGEACSQYGLSQCSSSYFCPNSPGKCSTYGGGQAVETGDCDFSCNNFSACKTDLCEYRSALNKCVKKNQTCSLSKTIDYNLGLTPFTAIAECVVNGTQNRWVMKVSTSCPDGWTAISGGRCMENNTTCSICDSGFKCLKETASSVNGNCFIDQNVCPIGSICGNNNKCAKTDDASCECCCRIGHDNEDCCSPLKCEGKCGSDITANTNTYGHCSGCASVGTTQAEHNEACNCLGTSGKFCLIDSKNPQGICQDCAQISNAATCSEQGEGTCCVDAKRNNACVGGAGPYASGLPNYNYCGYYECNSSVCSGTPIATSTLPSYRTPVECSIKCAAAPQFGATCMNENQDCDNSKCIGFSCLNENSGGFSPGNCGICCCDPYASQDSCKTLNTNLTCEPNRAPCTGDKRGLCCGCTNDGDCGGTIGCGTDTCCHARPTVAETWPNNGAENICRNTLIKATFDQAMQINSFVDNIVVVGDYGIDQCPSDTKYLTAAYKPNLLEKISYWLSKMPILSKFFAYQAKALTGNFCAVSGNISGYATSDNKTVLEFKPKTVLEANRKYYVIIKGDSNINDAAAVGVLSETGVALGQEDSEIFNSLDFKGKIWSFTTKQNTASDNGVCLMNLVVINPYSYLFNTSINDSADDNIGNDYDTIKDSDKVFRAEVYSPEKQPIIPIENIYNWRWDWNIADKKVVKFKNGENALDDSQIQTLVAQDVKEAKTVVRAKATITQDKINKTSTVGKYKEKTAQVYVFLCANPWPSFNADGSWEPWRDASGNCTATTGDCSATNFEVYYCRDAGNAGTADDLPAILSDRAVIRGYSAQQNILKEFYFFREGTPNISGVSLTATMNDEIQQGKKAGLVWQEINVPANEQLDKYLIYYGTKSGNYEQSFSVSQPGTISNPVIISNLINDVKYYFAVTAKYKSGAESGYSNEIDFTPTDDWAPLTPQGVVGEAQEGKAIISWQANQDDTAIYKIYYGATSGTLGASATLEKSKCLAGTGKCEITIDDLAKGTIYYFAAAALDLKGNESNKSAEINLTIL